ncbi:MAG: AbgT family transporter [Brevundimonas sp.]|uniref:AbgT family transporter n=1 Tax=Brevundimonas sp. TaxID=1871086 RepID=UPI0027377A2A|nr:AbgT family transporter [Brevundimonas sp.]MDP3404110.1 AbgT family transporter [Brevundimonas sp.]
MTDVADPGPEPSRKRGRWLDRIEGLGNALPDPVFILAGCIVVLVAVSVLAAQVGWSAVNPVTGERLAAISLLSRENVTRLLVDMPETLTRFPPLGLVLSVMLGAAVAERSGLFAALLGGGVRRLPTRFLTPAVFIIALFSHHAADAAYVVLIPLTALVFAKAGRHPLAGVAIAYAGISGAFAGNIVPGQFDLLMLGITAPAAQLIDPAYGVNPLGNWWFTLAIGVLFTPIAWFVTDRIIEPRLGRWSGQMPEGMDEADSLGEMSPLQRRGLMWAGVVALGVISLFAALVLWPGGGPLIDTAAEGPRRLAPFYGALVAGFMILFLGCGWAFGAVSGTIPSHRTLVRMMGEGMRDVAPYIVLAFFAAHFVAMFAWSNLGPVLAVSGADALKGLELPRPLLLVSLLGMSSGLDLVIGSASAKWSAMAPVVVPMLMLLGVSPEMTTAAYRMGDSIFNIVTPLASNFPLVLIISQRWKPDFGIGSMIALMLPYSIAFGLAGIALVTVWVSLDLPVGPGAPASYTPPPAIASVLSAAS